MNDEELEEPEEPVDPRRRLLSSLTPQQRYILYILIAIGVAVVLFIEISSH